MINDNKKNTDVTDAKKKKSDDVKKASKKVSDAKKANEKKKAEEKKKADKKKTSDKKKSNKKSKSGEKKSSKWNFKYLGGLLFAKMMRGGASELRANAEEVNKLNVFPVPDGDTGDNMRMTIESGIAAIENINSDNLAEVMKALSHGMLLGARGNSGVILSQFFAGIAKGLPKSTKADAVTMGRALEMGVEQAYASVMAPTEGTILTVAREAVEYAVSRITPESTIKTLFADLVREMHASVDRTPEILEVLKDAGVVDSGGAGLFYIIDGINRVLNGEEVASAPIEAPASAAVTAQAASFGPDSEMTFGYCTEMLVQLMRAKCDIDNFDIEATKSFLSEIGDSIVAFKTDSIVKIHVHTRTPEKVIAHMREVGEFITVKIENMSLQHTELSEDDKKSAEAAEAKAAPKKKYGVVAVSNGEGISAIFREMGADEIVVGGQTNNPSTNDFIDSFDRINAEHIFVFPNNGNIVMAAGQAAEIYEKAKIHVIPSKSIGAGYVALSSMNFDSSEPDELVAEADEAISRITAAYISPAVRDADMNGVHVNEGDTIGIIAKEIAVSEPTRIEATHALLRVMLDGADKFMLTVFCGKDAPIEEREELEAFIKENYPDIEFYFIDGGQEVYPYLIVAE